MQQGRLLSFLDLFCADVVCYDRQGDCKALKSKRQGQVWAKALRPVQGIFGQNCKPCTALHARFRFAGMFEAKESRDEEFCDKVEVQYSRHARQLHRLKGLPFLLALLRHSGTLLPYQDYWYLSKIA